MFHSDEFTLKTDESNFLRLHTGIFSDTIVLLYWKISDLQSDNSQIEVQAWKLLKVDSAAMLMC